MTSMTKHGIALFGALMARLGRSTASRLPTHGDQTVHSDQTVHGDNAERGDVPGWVMITLMSAVLVAALLALAGPALEAMFNQAMDTVGK
jgi:hypothetical protein